MIFLGYVFVFGGAGLASLAGAYRARKIPDRDTRHGLIALLSLSGIWALAQMGYLSVPGTSAKIALYLTGLVAGFATVLAWLYFCFSYTGRSLHHNPVAQRIALGLLASIALIKFTNPLHHFYFSTEWVATPFPHLAVQNHSFHWITFGLAYSLSAVGIFVMVEFLAPISSSTRPLVGLVGLTSLPGLFDIAGHASSSFVDVGHEPIGVAVFAIGILFVYADQFQDAQLTGSREAPVVVLGGSGQVRTYNEEAAALFPALRTEVALGNRLEEVVPELARVRRQTPPLLEMQVDDTQKWFLVSESGLGTGYRRPGRMLVLNDVTHQKEREHALQAAKEKAEEASRLKSEILANMKHEVRTPLTSILSFAGILKNNVSGQNARYVDLVIRGGERLQETLDSVIRLSELETGSVEIDGEPVDLAYVVDTTVELLRPEAEDNGIHLAATLPDAPVKGRWDEDALFHIVENLLENALKFTPEGGRVEARVRENGTDALLEVEDTGIGLSEDDRTHIFEAFRQVEQGSAREYGGVGLGLSIVKKLTDALSGHIDIESTPDEGSRFTVTLPRTPPSENEPDRGEGDEPRNADNTPPAG